MTRIRQAMVLISLSTTSLEEKNSEPRKCAPVITQVAGQENVGILSWNTNSEHIPFPIDSGSITSTYTQKPLRC